MRQASESRAHSRSHAPTEAIDCSAQRKAWLRHHEDSRTLPRLNPSEIGLAEIADRIPMLGVDDGEKRMTGIGELPRGDLERGDAAVAWRANCCLAEVALSNRERRTRPVQLRQGGLCAGDGLPSFRCHLPRPVERNPSRFLGGSRLIDLFGRHKTASKQRLHPIQSAHREFEFGLGGVDPGRSGSGSGSLRRNLACRDGELCFQRLHISAGLIHAKLVRLWVDLEEHLAFLDLLIVEHVECDDAAAYLRRHIDDVRLNGGVIGARPFIRSTGYEHSSDDDDDQRDKADEDAQQSADCRHWSMTEHKEPDEPSGGQRQTDIGQQRGDDVLADANDHENLPDDDRGNDARHRAQHPGRKIRPKQIQGRRVGSRDDPRKSAIKKTVRLSCCRRSR